MVPKCPIAGETTRASWRLSRLAPQIAVALVILGAVLLAPVASARAPEAAQRPGHPGYIYCGNPPNWSGVLRALHLGCGQARRVFHNISCLDPACNEIHSHNWSCHRHLVGRFQSRGVCSRGNKRVRWRVSE
jgi:hypothetical protein